MVSAGAPVVLCALAVAADALLFTLYCEVF